MPYEWNEEEELLLDDELRATKHYVNNELPQWQKRTQRIIVGHQLTTLFQEVEKEIFFYFGKCFILVVR